MRTLFLVPVIAIFSTLFKHFIYALLTDWELNQGILFVKACEPLFPNIPSSKLSKLSLPYGVLTVTFNHFGVALAHFTLVASTSINTTFVKLMHMNPSKSSSAPRSSFALVHLLF